MGSKPVKKLREQGHEAIAAAPNTGINSLTGEGLAEVLKGAAVVVDVSNSPLWEDSAMINFFETSTRNLLSNDGAKISERTLLPGKDAKPGKTRFETWLKQSARRAA